MKTIFRRGVHSRKWPRHLAYAILVMLLVIGWMLSVSLTSTSTFAQEPVDPPTEEQPAPTEIPTPTPTPTEAPAPMDPPAEEPAPTDPPAEEPAPTDPPAEEPAPTDPPAEEPAPTDPPAEEPAPTETPTATPVPTETPVPLPSDPPTISSDKADYAPGELVTLTGANWQGDDQVRIIVNDDWGSSWRRDEMVPVADDGTIVDTFNLPTWFVATYSVVATGQETGRVATTSFTDAADITLSKHRGQQKAADGTLSWPSGSQNTTIYAETEPINFRFEVATSVTDAVGQVQIEFSKEDATCNFFDGTLVLGTWNGEANAVEPITSFTTLPTVTFDSITVVGTDYVATLTIEFSDPGSFELYYYLTVSDNVVGCTGSSQHSRIGPGSDNVGPSGAQNVPVPANEIIRLPEITVIKNIDRNGDGSFEDTADAGEYCFTLDGGSCVPTDSSGQVLFSNVTPDGDHTVTETQLDFTQGIYEFVSGSGTNCTFSDSTATAEVYAGTTATNATCIFNNGLSVFSPTLVTTPNPTSGTVGVTLNDTATLSDGYNPEGSITFKLYAPGDDTCSGTPVYEETVAVSGNGDYSTSPGFASNAVGTWNWTAEYSGDTHNNPASSGCSDEPVTVNQETPSIVTSASGPVTVGAAIHDTATLSGGYNPTGSITFKLWGPSETATCTGDPIFTADVTVNGNGSYDSPDYTTTAAGTYYWTAEYSGDGNNEDASTSCGDANESSTVNQETPTITTTPNPWSAGLGDTLNDTATLSGGYNPQGTIIFRLYDPSDDTCTGPPAFEETVSVNGNDDYSTTTGHVADMLGIWRWTAEYSGDPNNCGVISGCQEEQVIVKLHPGTIGFWKNWDNHYTDDQFNLLIDYLKEYNWKVYNRTDNPRDDLTIAKVGAIFDFGKKTPRDQMILAQLTGLKFNLAVTQLDGTDGIVQKNDDICLDTVVDVSGIRGARRFFGTPTPKVSEVVDAVEAKWVGQLRMDRKSWKFRLSKAEQNIVIKTLTGINEGDIIIEAGCDQS